MSTRGAAESEGTKADERRHEGAPRVHFEALVAVGSTESDGGFDAESIDVSAQGMRLRSDHLPKMGERLIARFDGAAGELVVEGEVAWVAPAERGGEFGVRFVELDDETAEAVKAMCVDLGVPDAAPAPAPIAKGARVRLHIEGLGSPMKARVRTGSGRVVEVGSNLDFLRVDRALELEDVEKQGKQEAWVDAVKVEIDPDTKVPQLVVSLRLDEKRAAAKASDDAPRSVRARARSSEKHHDDEVRDDDVGDEQPGLGSRVVDAGRAAAAKVGPALSLAGSKAKGAFSALVARIKAKREEEADGEPSAKPLRRTTSVAPSRSLRTEGRRGLRSAAVEEIDDEEPPVQKRGGARRALAIGAVVGLVSLLAFGAFGKLGKRTPPEPVAAASASALPEGALASGEAQSANVPLFGATPMTTVEAVPPPPPPAMAAGTEPTPETGDAAGGSSDDEEEELKKEWGERSVKNGNKLKLKLDGEADGFRASQGEQGFTLVVPGRKFVGSASELARKDKRLSMLNVVNKPDATEITVEFKGDAPAYAVKAKGETIEISLSSGDKKVASKTPAKKKDGKKKAAKAPAKSAAKAPAKGGKKNAR